jgi:lysyl-tRNA synthetase class I
MFRAIYLGLIGRERGPRFGGFVVAWGLVPAAGALDALASAEA